MKLIFLVLRQFSRFFIRELIIIVQILVLVSIFEPTVTELINLFAVDKLSSQFIVPAVYLQTSAPYQFSDYLPEEDLNKRFLKIEECAVVKDAGFVANGGCTINNRGTTVYFYNDVLVKNIRLEIIKGSMIYENAKPNQISVMINKSLAELYNVGDVITVEKFRFPVASIVIDFKDYEFVVAGVLNDNGYYYTMNGGGSYTQLESIGGNVSSNEYEMIATTRFDIVPIKDILPSCMLFTDDTEVSTIDTINTELTGLGNAVSIEEMRKNSIRSIVLDNPLLMVSAVMLLLLCITGICSYAFLNVVNMRRKFSIYYICGMSWGKSLSITIISLTVLLAVSFAAAIIILPFIWNSVSTQGLLYSSLLIVFLYILSITVAVVRYKNIDPVALLRKGD